MLGWNSAAIWSLEKEDASSAEINQEKIKINILKQTFFFSGVSFSLRMVNQTA